MNTRRTFFRSTMGNILIVLCLSSLTMAKMRFFSLAEKTRESDYVLIGDIAELGNSFVIVVPKKAIKGALSERQIKLAWDRKEGIEMPVARHQVGDEVLIFANKKGPLYAPFGGPQGTLKLEKTWAEQYEGVVKAIIDFDVAKSTAQQLSILASMLNSRNRLMHDAALLEVISLYPTRQRSDYVKKNLVPAIVILARGSDKSIANRATQALASIGGKEVVPLLIELVGSDHESVGEIASRTLSQKTGVTKMATRRQTLTERKELMREWQNWWQKNKVKARLRE
jgi:hypothetical protein